MSPQHSGALLTVATVKEYHGAIPGVPALRENGLVAGIQGRLERLPYRFIAFCYVGSSGRILNTSRPTIFLTAQLIQQFVSAAGVAVIGTALLGKNALCVRHVGDRFKAAAKTVQAAADIQHLARNGWMPVTVLL